MELWSLWHALGGWLLVAAGALCVCAINHRLSAEPGKFCQLRVAVPAVNQLLLTPLLLVSHCLREKLPLHWSFPGTSWFPEIFFKSLSLIMMGRSSVLDTRVPDGHVAVLSPLLGDASWFLFFFFFPPQLDFHCKLPFKFLSNLLSRKAFLFIQQASRFCDLRCLLYTGLNCIQFLPSFTFVLHSQP